MPAPLWGTFCGVSNGLWVGTSAAYNPYTGPPVRPGPAELKPTWGGTLQDVCHQQGRAAAWQWAA